MADLNICRSPDIITTLGLGSCIGLSLYDPVTKIGGLVHYMLPDSTEIRFNSNIAKFADTGINELLRCMLEAGAERYRLQAKMAGGAMMFKVGGISSIGNIGQRNTEAAHEIMRRLGIPIMAEDTGADYGRTVELHCEDGGFYIRSVGKPIKRI
jgi:chemotaxis protein CheD